MSRLFKIATQSYVWLFTDGDIAVSHAGDTYEPAYIEAEETTLSSSIEKSTLEVRVAITNAMGQYLLLNFVEANVSLTVFKSLVGGIKQVWKGSLFSLQPDDKRFTLAFETLKSTLQKRGPRFKFQRHCPYTVYAIGCNKEKNDVAEELPVVAVAADGITLTTQGGSGFVNGYFTLGMVELPDGSFRTIVQHDGDTLTMSYPTPALAGIFPQGWGYKWGYSWGGKLVLRFFPGCTGTRKVCDARFNNLVNYGGCPEIPLDNPTGKVY